MRPVPIPAEYEDDNWHRQVIAPPEGHDPFESTIGTIEALVGFELIDGAQGVSIVTHWVLDPDELGAILACVAAGVEPKFELRVYNNVLPPVAITVETPR